MGSGVAQRKEGLRAEVASVAGEGVRVCAYTQHFLVVGALLLLLCAGSSKTLNKTIY